MIEDEKEIIFHPYALYKMNKRNISKQEVIKMLKEPHSIMDGKYGRRLSQRVCGHHVLRVIYEEYKDHILVITAYPAKAERKDIWEGCEYRNKVSGRYRYTEY